MPRSADSQVAGVDRVAAAFENLDAGLRGQRLAGRDDPVLRGDL